MKIFWLRIVFGIGVVLAVMSVERVVGLPVMSLTLLMILMESIALTEKMVVALVMGVVLALFYGVPMAIGVVITGVLVWILERRSSQARQRFGYMLLTEFLILTVLAFLIRIQPSWQFWLLHLGTGVVAIVMARYSLRAK